MRFLVITKLCNNTVILNNSNVIPNNYVSRILLTHVYLNTGINIVNMQTRECIFCYKSKKTRKSKKKRFNYSLQPILFQLKHFYGMAEQFALSMSIIPHLYLIGDCGFRVKDRRPILCDENRLKFEFCVVWLICKQEGQYWVILSSGLF